MAKKPTRDQFPKGLLGNRRYQLALEAYNRGIQPPKPKPTNNGRRPNTNPTAAEVRGQANKTAPVKEMPESFKVKPNRLFITDTGELSKRYEPDFYGPGGSATVIGRGQAQQNPLSPEQRAKIKPKPAEVQPAKSTVRASEQKPTVQKPAVKQSSDMDKNYEAWAKSNRKLAEKVKPGQAGYDAIQKALGKSSSTNGDMKIKPENKTNTAAQRTQEAAEATKPTSKVKPQEFNTRNVFETAEQRRRRLAMEKLAK